MRVIAGSLKGRRLKTPDWEGLRPTSDKLRETLFNILAPRIAGARVLDAYAGTGALGIEALSRGATHATFVEGEAGAVTAILQSLARTSLREHGTVIRGRLPGALATLNGPFDLILLDPPYNDPNAEETLLRVDSLLAEGGTVVYEHASRYNPPQRPASLALTDRRVYGDTAIAFYRCQEGE